MAGVAAALPSGCSLVQWKAGLFPHEPDSAASHGWDWRRCCPAATLTNAAPIVLASPAGEEVLLPPLSHHVKRTNAVIRKQERSVSNG